MHFAQKGFQVFTWVTILWLWKNMDGLWNSMGGSWSLPSWQCLTPLNSWLIQNWSKKQRIGGAVVAEWSHVAEWSSMPILPCCKHVYFCCKLGHYNMGVNGDWLLFIASLKWPLEQLQILSTSYFQSQTLPPVPNMVLRSTEARIKSFHISLLQKCKWRLSVNIWAVFF